MSNQLSIYLLIPTQIIQLQHSIKNTPTSNTHKKPNHENGIHTDLQIRRNFNYSRHRTYAECTTSFTEAYPVVENVDFQHFQRCLHAEKYLLFQPIDSSRKWCRRKKIRQTVTPLDSQRTLRATREKLTYTLYKTCDIVAAEKNRVHKEKSGSHYIMFQMGSSYASTQDNSFLTDRLKGETIFFSAQSVIDVNGLFFERIKK